MPGGKSIDYHYPAGTPGADGNTSGIYWNNLSDESRTALDEILEWIKLEKIDMGRLTTSDLHPNLLLLRYLRANQFDVNKTREHMLANIAWRSGMNIPELMKQIPEEILGCSMEELTAVFPHWHHGYDKTGRPVLFKQYGKFDATVIKKLAGGNFDNVVKYHVWEQETGSKLCTAQSHKLGLIVETMTGVIDLKNMRMFQITRDFLNLTKALAEVDQKQYPETLGRIFIVNAPSAFPLVWRVVKPWLDPATVEKISVYGSPSQFIPVLQEHIGVENLPENYGGTLPPLNPTVHPYSETMKLYAKQRARLRRIESRRSQRSQLSRGDSRLSSFSSGDEWLDSDGNPESGGGGSGSSTNDDDDDDDDDSGRDSGKDESKSALSSSPGVDISDIRAKLAADREAAGLSAAEIDGGGGRVGDRGGNQYSHVDKNKRRSGRKHKAKSGAGAETTGPHRPHGRRRHHHGGRNKGGGSKGNAASEKTTARTYDSLSYPYPDNTIGATSTSGQFWHNLDDSSTEKLAEVEQWVAAEHIDLSELCTSDLHPTYVLLRYLRANQFDTEKTVQHIQTNIAWRREKNIPELMKQTPEEILGCSMKELTAVFPHWHHGYDKTGRPVLFKQYGKFDAGLVKKLTGGNFDNVLRYHLWEQEMVGALCTAQSHKTGKIVETASGVVDVKNMRMFQITRDFLNLTKGISEIDQKQYPETLGRIFIINVPSVFPLVWRGVKPWLDPATVEKISIYSSPSQYLPVLKEFIGEDNLPENYGGTLPPLNPSVHPYAEVMRDFTPGVGFVPQDSGRTGAGSGAGAGGDEGGSRSDGTAGSDAEPSTAGPNNEHRTRSRSRSFDRLSDTKAAARDLRKAPSLVVPVPDRSLSTKRHVPRKNSTRWLARAANAGPVAAHTSGAAGGASGGELTAVAGSGAQGAGAAAAGGAGGGGAGQMGEPDWTGGWATFFNSHLQYLVGAGPVYESDHSSTEGSERSNRHSTGSPGASDDGLDYEDAYDARPADDLESGPNHYHRHNQHRHGAGRDDGEGQSVGTMTEYSDDSRPGKGNTVRSALLHDPYNETTEDESEFDHSPWSKRILCRATMWFYWRLTCDKALKKMSIQKLEKRLRYGLAVHFLCCLAAVIISAITLEDTQWSSKTARVQLWAAIVVVLVAAMLLVFDAVGYFGVRTRNWALLLMYLAGICLGILVFAVVTIACFLYYYVPGFTGVGDSALDSAFRDDESRDQAEMLIREYTLTLGVGCLVATLLSLIPLLYARVLVILIRRAQGKILRPQQVQVVLRIAQSISTLFAVVMIGYGSFGVNYLLQIRYVEALFPIFGLVYGGVAVLISATFGIWAAWTVHRSVLRLYNYLVLPVLIIVLLMNALLNFSSLYSTDSQVSDAYSSLSTGKSEEDIKVTVQTFLIVTGVLCTFLCAFQAVSWSATRSLSKLMDSASDVINEKVEILRAMREKDLLGVYSVNMDSRENSFNINSAEGAAGLTGVDYEGGDRGAGGGEEGEGGYEGDEEDKACYYTHSGSSAAAAGEGGTGEGGRVVRLRKGASKPSTKPTYPLTAIQPEHRSNSSSNESKSNRLQHWHSLSITALSRLYMIHHRGHRDRLLILWGVCMGLWNIFFVGTYAIFGAYMVVHRIRSHWEFSLWRQVGYIDNRFQDSNDFVLSSAAMLALLVGPLMLLFAWATFVLAPYRHILGIATSSVQIFAALLMYISEAYNYFHSERTTRPGLVFTLALIAFVFYVVVPGWVLYREAQIAAQDTASSDSQELLLDELHTESMVDPFGGPAGAGSGAERLSWRSTTAKNTVLNRHAGAGIATNAGGIADINRNYYEFYSMEGKKGDTLGYRPPTLYPHQSYTAETGDTLSSLHDANSSSSSRASSGGGKKVVRGLFSRNHSAQQGSCDAGITTPASTNDASSADSMGGGGGHPDEVDGHSSIVTSSGGGGKGHSTAGKLQLVPPLPPLPADEDEEGEGEEKHDDDAAADGAGAGAGAGAGGSSSSRRSSRSRGSSTGSNIEGADVENDSPDEHDLENDVQQGVADGIGFSVGYSSSASTPRRRSASPHSTAGSRSGSQSPHFAAAAAGGGGISPSPRATTPTGTYANPGSTPVSALRRRTTAENSAAAASFSASGAATPVTTLGGRGRGAPADPRQLVTMLRGAGVSSAEARAMVACMLRLQGRHGAHHSAAGSDAGSGDSSAGGGGRGIGGGGEGEDGDTVSISGVSIKKGGRGSLAMVV